MTGSRRPWCRGNGYYTVPLQCRNRETRRGEQHLQELRAQGIARIKIELIVPRQLALQGCNSAT